MGDGTIWFDEARLGMFVHWSHSSQLGCDVSWPLVGGVAVGGMSSSAIPIDTYHAGADTFCPTPGAARRWCELAAEAGARYAVLTTKHHDGFALWPSALTDWHIGRTPYDGDLVGEFADACREFGLRVGLYHSLSDWHHPDYPPFTEAMKPYPFIGYPRPDPEAWDRYLDVLHGQVRELLTGYGDIAVMWFDGQWERTPAEWRADELRALIRDLQPGCLVNQRLPCADPDFDTPEQFLPPEPPEGRWEMCLTMGGSWGYLADDTYKPASSLVRTACEVAGKGGNLLLNVGPGPDGALPAPQVERLEAIAAWMRRHPGAIHGTTAGLEPWQWYGPSTRKGDRTFLFAPWRPQGEFVVRGVPIERIERVVHLASGEALPFTTRTSVIDELINPDPMGEVTVPITEAHLDELVSVFALDIRPA
jgi:alpha-L-fucosidase